MSDLTLPSAGAAGWDVLLNAALQQLVRQGVRSTALYTAAAAIPASDIGKLIIADSATAMTLTLPALSLISADQVLVFSAINAGVITLTAAGTDKIWAKGSSNVASITLSSGESISLVYDATGGRWIQRDSTGISQGVANELYAALAGNAAQLFSAANGMAGNQVVNYAQVIPFLPVKLADVTPATFASGGSFTQSHSLGVNPSSARLRYTCLVAEQGYSVGDVQFVDSQWNGSITTTLMPWASNTQVGVQAAAGWTAMLRNKTTGAGFTPTAANWSYGFTIAK